MSNGQAGKTDVCHVDGQGGAHVITVSQNALSSHLAHGDYAPSTGAFVIPAGSTFTASSTWNAGFVASNAFDGSTATEWNAGAHPTQWIEVDFGSPKVITGMSGIIDVVPDGFSNHDVTFDGAPAFSFTGNFVQGQTLTQTFATPQTVQKVRITTTVGESWVAWTEIQFQGLAGSC
jgi:hypothetical protein